MTDTPTSTPCPHALGQKFLIGLLTFLNAFVPISTDLYLPALPHMARIFNADADTVNLTLSLFMLVFAFSMLIWGPLSDKYGRKPILFTGFCIYILSSILCANAPTITWLIIGRCIQALSCGALSSVSMAIVKDTFRGRLMESVLALIQTMTVLSPMFAPMIGAFLLNYLSWRGTFWALSACGVIALALSLGLRETVGERTQGSPFRSLGRIGFVLKNSGYRWLLLLFSCLIMPFMAFLASSSYIYINFFQRTSQEYSFFFLINAVFSMLGPILYMRVLRNLPRIRFLRVIFILVFCFGALLFFFGEKGPFFFALLYAPVTFCCACVRPLGTVLMMSQHTSDNGTVASLIVCTALLCGSISMMLSSLNWGASFIFRLSVITMVIGAFSLATWTFMNHKKVYKMPEH